MGRAALGVAPPRGPRDDVKRRVSFLTPRNPLMLPMGEGGDRNGEEAVPYVAKRFGRGRVVGSGKNRTSLLTLLVLYCPKRTMIHILVYLCEHLRFPSARESACETFPFVWCRDQRARTSGEWPQMVRTEVHLAKWAPLKLR